MKHKIYITILGLISLFMVNQANAQLTPMNIGLIEAGDSIMIYYEVKINDPLPGGVTQITSQGVISGSNITTSNTDDPDTAPLGDATITNVVSNQLPSFVNGASTTLTVCQGSANNAINSLLAVTDADNGQTLTWTVTTAPTNGTANGFPATASSNGATVTPAGLSYSNTSGTSDVFVVQVSDGTAMAQITVNVTVNANPAIAGPGQPVNATTCAGGNASFTVTATGAPTLTYQWRKGITPLTNTPPYSNVTTATLNITNAQPADAATDYNVIVSNLCSSVTSSNASLTVNTAPTIGCPGNQAANTSGACNAVVTYSSSSTGSPAPAITYSFAGATTGSGSGNGSGSTFNVGTTTVTLSATNICAPVATCSFDVVVTDTDDPNAICQNITVELDINHAYTVTAAEINNGSTDNCGVQSVAIQSGQTTYSCADVGQTFPVTILVTDIHGRTSTCTGNVTVADNNNPCNVAPSFTAGVSTSLTVCTNSVNNAINSLLAVSDGNSGQTLTWIVVTPPANGTLGGFPATASSNGGTVTPTGLTYSHSGAATGSFVIQVSDGIATDQITINITAENAPVITSITGVQNVCPYIGNGTQITYTATAAGATSFNWVLPPNVNIVSGIGTASLTVTFSTGFAAQGNKQLRVTATSACGTGPLAIHYLVAQQAATPAPITGPTNVCGFIGAGTATYSIPPAGGAASYNWVAQNANATITHPNGPGLNDTIVNVSFAAGFTTSTLTVQAVNSCAPGGIRSLTLNATASATPGLISGPTNGCPHTLPGGTAATYTIALVSGATSYNWNAPAGSVVTHPNGAGANDNIITVKFPNGFTSGAITVSSTNGCGTGGTRTLNISKLNPSTPGVIDVIQTQPCPNRVYTYTISSMPLNTTTLNWTYPAAGTLISGQGTTSITVSYPPTSVDDSVTVQAVSNCASSAKRKTLVKIPVCSPPPPPPPFARGGHTNGNPQLKGILQETTGEAIEVRLFPNPTVNDFKLQVSTAGKEIIHVRVLDVTGRVYQEFMATPFQTLALGASLKPGTYLLEVRQGRTLKMEKLVKF